MARTERESDRWRSGRLVGAAKTRMAQASAEKLEHNGPAKKGKSGLSATERAVGKNTGAIFTKRKRNRAISPEYQIMREKRVKVGESCTLA